MPTKSHPSSPSMMFLISTFVVMLALVGLFVTLDHSLQTDIKTAMAQSAPTPDSPDAPTPSTIGILPPNQTNTTNTTSLPTTGPSNTITSSTTTSTSLNTNNVNFGDQTVRSGGGQVALALIFITLSAGSVYLYYLQDQKSTLKTTEKKLY